MSEAARSSSRFTSFSPGRRCIPSLAACLMLTLGCAPGPAIAQDEVPAEYRDRTNPVTLDERGVRYYTRQFKGKCARCHGVDGKGSGTEAGSQAVRPADLTDAEYMQSRTDGELFYQILVGGEERSAMPAFGPTSNAGWSEDKIWLMVAFVRRFAEPGEPADPAQP
jgi:mono/diheme cytochrome c family protein